MLAPTKPACLPAAFLRCGSGHGFKKTVMGKEGGRNAHFAGTVPDQFPPGPPVGWWWV